MNVHSLSNPISVPFPLSESRRGECLPILVANRFKGAPLRRSFGTRRSATPLSYSKCLATVFRISSPTLLAQGVRQPERVALPGRTQRTDLASAAL